MKTYKQRTDDILKKSQTKRAQKRTTWIMAAVSCACAVFLTFNLVLFLPFNTTPPSVAEYKNSEYYPVIKQLNAVTYEPPKHKNNFAKLMAGVKEIFSFGCGAVSDLKGGAAVDFETNESGAGNGYVETTDNQVSGVIEGDLVKRTTSHIFYLSPQRGNGAYEYQLRVYSIEGVQSALVSSYTIPSPNGLISYYANVEAYLSQDGETLTVIGSCYRERFKQSSELFTELISLDISDPTNIREWGRNYIAGQYVSSRLVDGKILLVNNYHAVVSQIDFADENTFIPRYGDIDDLQQVACEDIVCPDGATNTQYAVVCEIDEKSLEIEGCVALLSYSSDIYVSQENLFVARAYENVKKLGDRTESVAKTEISCLYYGGQGIQYKGSFMLDGNVKNQYSMDEYEGVLRVVTGTEYRISDPADTVFEASVFKTVRNANLYCVRLSDFEIVGKVERFAPDGETVESVRFDGTKAYVCTAVVITLTDPVFAFDLSDMQNITCVDTGVIEGYSTSLVQFKDGYLLGVGYGEWDMLKIEIYEETETAVRSVCSYELSASFSEEYKSYFIDRERGLVGLGVYDYAAEHGNRYLLLLFDGYALTPIVNEELTGYNEYKRAVLIDGYFYMFGDEFKVVQIF